jgi:hypothetical protein
MCINTYSFDYLVQSSFFDGYVLKKEPLKEVTPKMNLNYLNRLVFEFEIDVEYLDLQKRMCLFIIRVVLTCALRAQVKNLKMELNYKLCLEKIRF